MEKLWNFFSLDLYELATDFMRVPSLAVELLFAATSSSTNHIIGLQHYSLFQGSMT